MDSVTGSETGKGFVDGLSHLSLSSSLVLFHVSYILRT